MKNNYCLFNHHEDKDTLLILFSDETVTFKRKSNEVNILYHDSNIVGYEIENFIRYVKIKYSGIIFLPNNLLVDVINSVLNNSQVEPLGYKTESGYIIKRNGARLGVYASEGTFLRDETISKGKFCTYYDLYIENENPNDLVEILDEELENKDFFHHKELF